MRRLIFISFLILGCSAKKTPSETPITYDDIMNEAWTKYSVFEFSQARNLFSQALSINSRDREAYYGNALSSASLSLYQEAFSLSSSGIFAQGEPPLNKVVSKIILNAMPDTILISAQKVGNDSVYFGFYYIQISDTPILEVSSIFLNNSLKSIYAFNRNKIIVPFTHVLDQYSNVKQSDLPKANDTILYAVSIPTLKDIDSLLWNVIILSSGLGYLSDNFNQAMVYGYLAYFTNPINSLKPRIVKRFKNSDNIFNLARILYKLELYYNLANLLHDVYPDWPYSNWGSNVKADIYWSYNNQNAIKSKFYEFLSTQP
jgi:hypothetical protein